MVFYISIVIFIMAMWSLDYTKQNLPFVKGITFVVLWLAAGTSANFSVDYPNYVELYNSGNTTAVEPVWGWFIETMQSLGFTSRIFFLFAEFIIISGFFYGIKKLSLNFWISILFFAVCYYYFESLNGVRQYAAMAIIFAATHWAIAGGWKIIYYLIAVLIAAQFHNSAYIMIPMIFAVRIKYPNWLLAAALIVTLIIGARIMPIMISYAFNLIGEGEYAGYATKIMFTGVSSGTFKYVLNFTGILVLLTANRARTIEPKSYMYVNMIVIGLVLYNIFFQMMVFLRLYWYFYPFIIIFIPFVLKSFTQKSRPIIIGGLVLLFAAFSLNMLSKVSGYSFDLNLLR